MRKIIIFLTLIMIASATLAAVVTPKKAANPVPVAASSSSSAVGLTGVTLTAGGIPAAHFGMGSWSLDLGGMICSVAGASQIDVLARANMPIKDLTDNLNVYWAPQLFYVSAAGASTITLSIFLGAEYLFAPRLSLFADLTAFTLTSTSAATNWWIGLNNGQIYTGGRIYL